MKIKIKKLNKKAVIPAYAHSTDAGMDLTVTEIEESVDKFNVTYHSGIAIEIPDGYVGLIFPRSSVYKTGMLMTNCVGVIDSGYRGEIKAVFSKGRGSGYKVGERFCQLIVMPYPQVMFEEVEELSKSDRGEGGYGSTGN